MNRAARRRLFLRINLACRAGDVTGSRQHDGKKRCRCRRRLVQFAPLQCTTPLEYLVRVHTVSTSHQRNTRTGLQCQLRYPPLLRHRSPSARPTPSSHFLLITHDDIVVLKPEVMPEGNSGRLLRGDCAEPTSQSSRSTLTVTLESRFSAITTGRRGTIH